MDSQHGFLSAFLVALCRWSLLALLNFPLGSVFCYRLGGRPLFPFHVVSSYLVDPGGIMLIARRLVEDP